MQSLADTLLSIPDLVKWALALIGILLGALFVLRTDRVIVGLRRWLIIQLRWVRRPGYRRLVKIYGWLLFVTGILLALILVLRG